MNLSASSGLNSIQGLLIEIRPPGSWPLHKLYVNTNWLNHESTRSLQACAAAGGSVAQNIERGTLDNTPEAVEAWMIELHLRFGSANILCQKHNNELGRTADATALQLYRHLKASHQPMELPGSRILRPPVIRRVADINFGRWLCKTHCNFMVAQGMRPDAAYVHYAFLHPPEKPVYFYFSAGLHEKLWLADGREPVVSWRQFLLDDQLDFDGSLISLAGFPTVPIAACPLLSTVAPRAGGVD